VGDVAERSRPVKGVEFQPLSQIRDERGAVLHMLRADAPWFEKFGEVYFSVVNAGAIKAWKRHQKMVQNIAIPIGTIRLVVFDDRPASETKNAVQVIDTGERHYGLVRIPPMVWYGFQGLAAPLSLIANCSTMPHDPDEVERREAADPAFPNFWVNVSD